MSHKEIGVLRERLLDCLSTLESRSSLSDEALAHLRALYSLIWVEACYDPGSEETEKFA